MQNGLFWPLFFLYQYQPWDYPRAAGTTGVPMAALITKMRPTAPDTTKVIGTAAVRRALTGETDEDRITGSENLTADSDMDSIIPGTGMTSKRAIGTDTGKATERRITGIVAAAGETPGKQFQSPPELSAIRNQPEG
jgi:hypothetical protein